MSGRHRRYPEPTGMHDAGARRHVCDIATWCPRGARRSLTMALTKIDDLQSLHMRYDLAIIGAGPAGMAAATEASAIGVRVVLFDENPAMGGQIYRAIETNTPAKRAFLGKDYWKGKEVLGAFLASDATYVPQSLVWSVEQQQ